MCVVFIPSPSEVMGSTRNINFNNHLDPIQSLLIHVNSVVTSYAFRMHWNQAITKPSAMGDILGLVGTTRPEGKHLKYILLDLRPTN